jgi:hypothetical protein
MSKVKHVGKVRYKGIYYHLAYADFKSLIGCIKKCNGKFYVFISSELSSSEKSKEFHRLLKDNHKFERGGRRNIPGCMKEYYSNKGAFHG